MRSINSRLHKECGKSAPVSAVLDQSPIYVFSPLWMLAISGSEVKVITPGYDFLSVFDRSEHGKAMRDQDA